MSHKKRLSGTNIKIKLEVDIDPPGEFKTEVKILCQPSQFSVIAYQESDLLAGKLHALLCRQWITRVKGRDWYDFSWFVSRHIPVGLIHLESRLKQSGHVDPEKTFTLSELTKRLKAKIGETDFEKAKWDVIPFLTRPDAVAHWSKAFFEEVTDKLKAI